MDLERVRKGQSREKFLDKATTGFGDSLSRVERTCAKLANDAIDREGHGINCRQVQKNSTYHL